MGERVRSCDKLKTISSSTKPMTTKNSRLVTYGERNPPMESHDPLTMRSCVATWQIKSIIYPLWQSLGPQNMTSWWLKVRWTYPWSHIPLWPRDHVRRCEKLKTKYFFFQKTYSHQTGTKNEIISANFFCSFSEKFQALQSIDFNPLNLLSHNVYQVCKKNFKIVSRN